MIKPSQHKIKTRAKRKFRPSKALMSDAFEAALKAGFDNARLDIAPNGEFSITAFNGDTTEHAQDEWDKAIAKAT